MLLRDSRSRFAPQRREALGELGDDGALSPRAHELRCRLDLGPHAAGAELLSREQVIRLREGQPPDRFLTRLREQNVPFIAGRGIVATWKAQHQPVREIIQRYRFDLDVILNKGSVMVLSSGVDKATGLQIALDELGLSPEDTVAVGDAENDRTMLAMSGIGVAVANALPEVKEQADVVTKGSRGAGVTELIEQILADDLASYASQGQQQR